jgi:hypothetical protein
LYRIDRGVGGGGGRLELVATQTGIHGMRLAQ